VDIHVEGSTAAAYVHKSEVSNRLYVTPEILPVLLPKGGEFAFLVKRFDDQHRVVELSRRRWLTLNFRQLEYGKVYECRVALDGKGKALLYGDELECTVRPGRLDTGQELDVFVARKGEVERELEVDYSSTTTREKRMKPRAFTRSK